MLRTVGRLVIRAAVVLLPRGAVTMTVAGSGVGYQSNYVDLSDVTDRIEVMDISGTLPHSPTKTYQYRRADQIKGLVFHHSATRGQTIRSMAEYQVEVRGWAGLGYHYAIGYDGRIYKCNDPLLKTNHTANHNTATIGAVLVGNYQEREPSEAMIRSAEHLEAYLMERYGLQFVWLHRETKPTLCPGDYAAARLRPLLIGPRP